MSDVLATLRPRQWTKNLVCFAALVFAGRLADPAASWASLVTFVCFSLAASGLYALNDVLDRDEDRAHPRKRHRPVAAGRLSPVVALALATGLVGAALALSLALAPRARVVLGIFVVLTALYSLGLKRVPVVDVMVIAAGFALRVQAGIEAIGSPQSAWILLCMYFVALFLACGKRRAELVGLGDTPRTGRRSVLGVYSVPLLDLLLALSATTALVCYALYAVTVQPHEAFLLTVLPVLFGVVRYAALVIADAGGEDPDELLTRDPALVLAVIVWGLLCVAVLYGPLADLFAPGPG